MHSVFVDRDNVNDEVVLIVNIYVENNTKVKKGDIILDFETSKSVIEITAPEGGVVTLEVELGEEVDVGAKLFQIDPSNSKLASSKGKIKKKETLEKNDKQASQYVFSKAALKKIKELKLENLTFNKKFINEDDVIEFANKDNKKRSKKEHKVEKRASNTRNEINHLKEHQNPFETTVPFEVHKTSPRKRAEIKSLTATGNFSTQSVIGVDIDSANGRISKPPYLFRGTIADLIVYETSSLIKKYPNLNSFFISDKEFGQYKKLNFGISFDSGKNLKVLALLDADKKSLSSIQKEINELLELYETPKNIPNEILTNSTIAISDLTNTGSNYMLPLLSHGHSVILGVVKGSNNFSIFAGFDHKTLEGLYVANFLTELKENIETHFKQRNDSYNFQCIKCKKNMTSEVSEGNAGLINITTPEGEINLICRNCFDGW